MMMLTMVMSIRIVVSPFHSFVHPFYVQYMYTYGMTLHVQCGCFFLMAMHRFVCFCIFFCNFHTHCNAHTHTVVNKNPIAHWYEWTTEWNGTKTEKKYEENIIRSIAKRMAWHYIHILYRKEYYTECNSPHCTAQMYSYAVFFSVAVMLHCRYDKCDLHTLRRPNI